jgi:hypothetical protein
MVYYTTERIIWSPKCGTSSKTIQIKPCPQHLFQINVPRYTKENFLLVSKQHTKTLQDFQDFID